MERRIEIFDSTLRDGAQAEGIHFSVDDKLNIVRKLDKLGIPYIEAGNPGSNPKDFEFFERVRRLELRSAQLVAFGSTRRKDIAVEDDKNCRALIAADTEVIALFGKSWALHVENVLQTTRAENLRMIYDTIDYFVSHGKTVFFDAEHFFDGFRADPGYALETLRAAAQAGAQRLVLCDTNGGSFPADIADGVRAVRRELDIPVAIHCHNDLGCAVANSIEAVRCGAVQVQGTYIGFGERCGNASLSTLIPALQLKMGCRCITDEAMGRVTHTARYIAEVANYILPASTPVVGKSAFAHKAGMHVDAVQKLHASFENFPPERVGNNRSLLISEVAGRTAVANRLAQLDPTVTRDSPVTQEVMDALKELEQMCIRDRSGYRRGYPHLCVDGQRRRVGIARAVRAGRAPPPGRCGGGAAGLLFAHRAALGQPAVQLGAHEARRVRLVDSPGAAHRQPVRYHPHRPLPGV